MNKYTQQIARLERDGENPELIKSLLMAQWAQKRQIFRLTDEEPKPKERRTPNT
jgi:hypothetical protein